MEIEITIKATIILQDGLTNINEIIYAIHNLCKDAGTEVCKGVIEHYQEEIIKMLCDGKGDPSRVRHEPKGAMDGEPCIGSRFRRAGVRKSDRKFRRLIPIWGERGVLAVANVIVMRIYSPEEWRRYWANLMDIKGRCFVRSFYVSFNVLS